MSLIVGTWGVVQKCFLDVADVVYVAFLMFSSSVIPRTPRIGSDNPFVLWTEHLFWYLGFSGFVYVVQGDIFCYNHPQSMVCTINAPGTLISVACWKQVYLFSDLFVQRPKLACHSEYHAVYRRFCYGYGINHCDDFVYSQIRHSVQLQHSYYHHGVYSKPGTGKCQISFPGDQFFAVGAASSFNDYPCNFGLDLFNFSYDPFVLV